MRQILVTVADHVREIDIADIIKNMMWHFENQIVSAEYLDGPRKPKLDIAAASRSDIDQPMGIPMAPVGDGTFVAAVPAHIAEDLGLPKFDASVIAEAQRMASEAEAKAGGPAPGYVVPSFDPKPRKGKRK